MKIRQDLLRVRSNPYDDRGEKIEPEQQPAQRVLTTDAEVSMQGGAAVGTLPTQIVYETTAGELARAMRHPCFSCKNFDARSWGRLYLRMTDPTAPLDQRQELNAIRAALLTTRNAKLQNRHVSEKEGDMDPEHALSQLGICRPLTEIHGTPVIVHPLGGCPPEVCTTTEPNGLYDPKDTDADRMGSKTFDNVMKLATGKPL